MIHVVDKKKCTGCAGCYNACPVDAIEMLEDREGFLYPVVTEEKCINCNRCDKVCPFVTEKERNEDLRLCFAAYNRNEEDRAKSSSGGIFIAMAKKVILEGGIVYGAAYDECFMAYHDSAENIEQLNRLIGSKYMQSRIGRTYREILNHLKMGRKVLFVGTGCQIAGLKGYLDRDYSNLITIDFICLGTPSPKVWSDYLETFFEKKEIVRVNFKDKSLGWHTFSLRIDGNENFVQNGRKTYFFSGYFKQLYSRPSCSDCLFKKGNRISDITISDCWGYAYIAPEMDDNKGLSSVECHSENGLALFEEIKSELEWKEANIEDVCKYNSNYCKSAPMGEDREKFWEEYDLLPKEELFKKYCQSEKESKLKQLIYALKTRVKQVMKK